MKRDIVDIPEVFRRAFEDEGWGGNQEGGRRGEGGGRGGRPWRPGRLFWLVGLAILVFGGANWASTTFTDWLWFDAVGYRNVWLSQWLVRIAVVVVAFVVAAGLLLFNWRRALAQARRWRREGGLPLLSLPGIGWLVSGAAIFVALVFAAAAGSQWQEFLLYANRLPFGVSDPIYGLDVGFYLFELPVYRFLQGWLTPLLFITLIGVAGLYLIEDWLRLQRGEWRLNVPAPLWRHAAVLAAVAFAMWAVGYWLDRYALLYSARGVAFGASYTDLNASRPALYLQLVLMLLLAVAAAANAFRRQTRLLLIAGGLWLAATLVVGRLYPGLLQRYGVEPNELDRERPYIEHNIAFTRLAYGLDKIEVREFGSVQELTNLDLRENEATVQNVRLWDYRPLQQTYAQLQVLRPYYEFASIDIDRYTIDGEMRQVMLAGRELNKQNLSAPSWVNQKLEFTHGYGLVMNPVDQVTDEGRPFFFIQDLPPQSRVPIPVDRPEIYYGELLDDVVYSSSDLREFDYPAGDDNVYSQYEGTGGVLLSNFLRRLAFAIRFGEANLLLSEYISPETRVMMYRQIRQRVQQITPFLTFDTDPYLVVADGRLVWMLDGYTISDDFPYATPAAQGYNYIRNAVKVTIDAYDGDVNYYLAAEEDPIIRAYGRAFPGLFKPLAEMPAALLAHIRYPEDLFRAQTRQYLKYHMLDVQVFYNEEDLWAIPLVLFEGAEQPIEPYYVILKLPGEENTEFLLIEPYTPAGRNNMIAWLAARNDPEHYGELVVYQLPKQELTFGPLQIEARIDQDPQISAQFSLWGQRGSRVIRGNLLVIPMNSSFLYVEPVYLLAETSELPELQRVIVASGNQIAMRETLDEALLALITEAPSVVELEGVPPGTVGDEPPPAGDEPAATSTPAATAPAADATLEQLVASANAHFESAQAAQRAGDWATYGRELAALQADLAQLMALSGEAEN
jgi:hypothetical protein